MEAAASPFPREETTPPVTKMYFTRWSGCRLVWWREGTQQIFQKRDLFGGVQPDGLVGSDEHADADTVLEGPELFELPVDGQASNTRWVIW